MGSSLFLTLFSGGGRYNVSSGRGGSGVTVVYLDRVLLLNLLVDYLLLLTTAQLAGIPLRRGRLALCAAVGALYAGAVFLPGLSWLSHPLCRTAGGAAMALAAWRREAHPWRLTALFFLLAGGLGGLVLALGLEHSRQATAAQSAVTEMTNELLKKNADTLKMGTIATAKEAERSIVDIETLQHTNQQLIESLDEVARIQQEGAAKRREAEAQLGRIEGELKQKLLELRG